jgi:hypothetical protein
MNSTLQVAKARIRAASVDGFRGERPVASAVLCIFEELGYLSIALTAEQALIAQRTQRPWRLDARSLSPKRCRSWSIHWATCKRQVSRVAYEKEV